MEGEWRRRSHARGTEVEVTSSLEIQSPSPPLHRLRLQPRVGPRRPWTSGGVTGSRRNEPAFLPHPPPPLPPSSSSTLQPPYPISLAGSRLSAPPGPRRGRGRRAGSLGRRQLIKQFRLWQIHDQLVFQPCNATSLSCAFRLGRASSPSAWLPLRR